MRALLLAMPLLLAAIPRAHAEMPHDRPCDIAQDSPGRVYSSGGQQAMFGLCEGVDDPPAAHQLSHYQTRNAFNCGYQAFRQGKVFGANPYYNDDLETLWSAGWKAARTACKAGTGPFD